MFSTLLHALIYCTLAATRPQVSLPQALLLNPQTTTMATTENRVPGHNNATFCNVSSAEQLFRVEFLDIAPSPLPVYAHLVLTPTTSVTTANHYPSNKIFFVYLRGTVPDEPGLADSRLLITAEATLASGGTQGPTTYTIPLTTASFGDNAHLAIRNATGAYDGGLSPGRNDVLTDCLIPDLFVRTGWWTFRVEGVLPDGRGLFCFEMGQWLEGKAM